MKILVPIILMALTMPAAGQSVDNELPQCRDYPFPFSVICLANKASYQPTKHCDEITQSRIYAAGQQCDAGDADRAGQLSREPKGRECSHSYKGAQ